MSEDEREIRAFEAIIVSQLLRERDPMNLNDLPELTEAQRAAMNALPTDLANKLWDEVDADSEDECTDEETCDANAEKEEFAGMNRAEEMDDETRKALDLARKEVIESMKKQRKEQGGANGSPQLAEKVLRSFKLWRLPVQPLEIAAQEGIVVRPGFFGQGFDARIEYYRSTQGFCIFHAEPGGRRTEGRVRFSLAHELGHFYLPTHRGRLLNGNRHNSESDFGSSNPIELEADEFAADLLMPMELFRAELNLFRNGFCTLSNLVTLAEKLGTSLTSTARRYCESDREPCTIFFSTNGLMHWGRASQDMKSLGMYFCETNNPPPPGSMTAELWTKIRAGEEPEMIEGRVPAEVWFKWPRAAYLWEEAMPLGTGRVITQLTPDD